MLHQLRGNERIVTLFDEPVCELAQASIRIRHNLKEAGAFEWWRKRRSVLLLLLAVLLAWLLAVVWTAVIRVAILLSVLASLLLTVPLAMSMSLAMSLAMTLAMTLTLTMSLAMSLAMSTSLVMSLTVTVAPFGVGCPCAFRSRCARVIIEPIVSALCVVVSDVIAVEIVGVGCAFSETAGNPVLVTRVMCVRIVWVELPAAAATTAPTTASTSASPAAITRFALLLSCDLPPLVPFTRVGVLSFGVRLAKAR